MQHRSLGAAVALSLTLSATAQESALSFAATQPAKTRFTWREQARFERFELNTSSIEQWTIDSRLTYGLDKDLSLELNIPSFTRSNNAPAQPDQSGLGDITLTLKHRFWQHDPGPIDTNRLAFFTSLRIPSGTDGLSTGGYDPTLGLTFTRISGRHGVNATARYTFTTDGLAAPLLPGTGSADLFTLETSYIFRLIPDVYTSDSRSSLYFSVESFLDMETDGSTSMRIAPGLLYEAQRFTFECSPIIPVFQEIGQRAELDWGIALGFRVLF